MTERLLTMLIAALVASGVLFMLPPGPSARIKDAVRYVTKPAQAWGDCLARISRAAVAPSTDAQGSEGDGGSDGELREKLARAQLEAQSARAAMEQMRWDLRLLGAHQASYQHPFSVAVGKVIQRDPLVSYYDFIMIDSGANDGVKPGHYVVGLPENDTSGTAAEPELLGIVTEVTATASRIMLMSHRQFSVPCTIPGHGVTGILLSVPKEAGQPLTRPAGELFLAYPAGDGFDAVTAGDKVYTSGLGEDANGVPNVLVGTVSEKALRNDGMPVIRLKPAVSLEHFSHVLVILGMRKK